jgi:PAS domain S-box-containing protein
VEAAVEHIFPGESEMARRMRQFDWSRTSLGPVATWPQPLRTAAGICLDCAFPIIVWWGPELAILYNDEYSEFLGGKHPAALGAPGATVWAEIWDIIGPMLSQVMAGAGATRSRDLLLHIERDGYAEEAYFSFSYSPIHEADGTVGGIFCPVIETTDKVIGERRLRTLRDLATHCRAESESAVYAAAASVLQADPFDVPFALIYRVADDGATAELQASAGIEPGSAAAPRGIALDSVRTQSWSLGPVVSSGDTVLLTELASTFETLPTGAWKVPPHSALALPIQLPGQDRPRAVLIAAISPMRALDDDYRTFFGLVATQIAAGLADAQALEEERRRVEALAEIDRAKTAFFSNVSHEFRTPLALMLGPLEETLANPALPRQVSSLLRVAHRNSVRLLKLVNTLLDFSRIEAGRVEASFEPTDLAAFTAELASVFRSAIEKAGLRLVVDCGVDVEPAYVDRDMWEKVVLNLLSNALKFTFDGEIRVALRRRGDRFELRVSDTGVGIPPADLPRMFQRFHRVKNARSRTHEGTGIGLAFVQELVKVHGGEVSVQSEEERGTTFQVIIPAGSAHLPAERIGTERRLTPTGLGARPFVEEALQWLPDAETGTLALDDEVIAAMADVLRGLEADRVAPRARIVLADDNADMREYVRRLLEHSYDVVAVADGQQALDEIRTHTPDLVVTDVMMPRLDGFGLLAAIRADERTRTLRVMMLSARAGEESRIEGLDASADDYMIKPFSARELLARVKSQLELARLRREAERALRYRGEQFETLLGAAPIGVYLVDADFRVTEVNPIAEAVFGGIPGGIVGRDFATVIHLLWKKEFADEMVRLFRRTLRTGEPYFTPERAELRIDRGVTEYYEWRLNRITLPDGRYGVVCYFRDISAQVMARREIEASREALKEADRRKDEFLAMLAHELRNPLAPVRNGLELMKLAGDDAETVAQARLIMQRQVEQMVRLVDDLLDVSRISRGMITLRKERVQLAAVVRSAIETSRPAIEVSSHRLTVEVPPEPIFVDADETRLAQVFTNLLNNAAKYTAPGGEVRLTVERRDKDAVIRVTDNGRGIPAHMLTKIFDMFTQVEGSFEKWQPGLGVGLSIAKRLVEMHGGIIEAHSGGRGAGSEFVVRVPVVMSLVGAGSGAAADDWSEARLRHRVLVADDNADAALSMALMLKLMGCETRTAEDGVDALKVAAAFRPNVVLLDIGMPRLDGYETCRRLREFPWGRTITVVALTGWGQSVDQRASQDAGFDVHLVKPADPGTLRKLLGRVGAAVA